MVRRSAGLEDARTERTRAGARPGEAPGGARRLAAILCADAKGYSRLVSDDEAATVTTLLETADTIILPAVAGHGGRLFKRMGDGFLAEFASVVRAVECGVAIQRKIAARGRTEPASQRLVFRIGISLGDVIVRGDDLYGDGVNIAARLQALAEPGAICITRAVHQMIRKRLDCPIEFGGEQRLRNIPEPIDIFHIRPLGSREPAGARPAAAGPIPEAKPSVAVLPTRGVLADPALAHFCEGLTDGIIANLSRFHGLVVIARHSAFSMKDRGEAAPELGRELGARYVLDSSMIQAGERIRVIARLTDADTGRQLWADQFDRTLSDLLVVQDEITQILVAALNVRVEQAERARLSRVETDDLESYGHLLRGNQCFRRYTRESFATARRHYQEAIRRDATYARAHAELSRLCCEEFLYGWAEEPGRVLDEALALAHRAIDLDPLDARAHADLGVTYLWKKKLTVALSSFEKAVALNPNDADIMVELADALMYAARPAEAVTLVQKAIRLNPYHPEWYHWVLAGALYALERYEDAVLTVEQMPDPSEGARLLAASYAQLGRLDEARQSAAAVLAKHPEFTIAHWAAMQPDAGTPGLAHFVEGLRKAGLPG